MNCATCMQPITEEKPFTLAESVRGHELNEGQFFEIPPENAAWKPGVEFETFGNSVGEFRLTHHHQKCRATRKEDVQ